MRLPFRSANRLRVSAVSMTMLYDTVTGARGHLSVGEALESMSIVVDSHTGWYVYGIFQIFAQPSDVMLSYSLFHGVRIEPDFARLRSIYLPFPVGLVDAQLDTMSRLIFN